MVSQIDKSICLSTPPPLDLLTSTVPPIHLSSYLHMPVCLSVYLRLSVRPSVRPAVYLSLSIAISGSLCALYNIIIVLYNITIVYIYSIFFEVKDCSPTSSSYARGLAASRSILFRPCRHVCCCSACAENLDRCPVCREPAELKENVYVP